MIEYGIRSKLLATSGVYSLLGGATKAAEVVSVMHATQGTRFPLVTITRVSDVPIYEMAGATVTRMARIQIDCWDQERGKSYDPYAAMQALADAVEAALSGFRGTAGDYTVQRCFLSLRRPLSEPDNAIAREMMDFELHYRAT